MKHSPITGKAIRAICLFTVAALGLSFAQAQEKLTEEQREEAAAWLQQAKESFNNISNSRLRKAVSAIQEATASETAAMSLYMAAMKDSFTNTESFTSMRMGNTRGRASFGARMMSSRGGARGSSSRNQSPTSAFNEWKKQMTGANSRPGFKKALQIQLKWMLICLQKADADRSGKEMDLTAKAQSILSEISANAEEIADQIYSVGGASSVIREYLNVSDYRPEDTPENIGDIGSFFDQIILKPYVEKEDFVNYRKLYQNRIALEAKLVSVSGDDKKTAEASAAQVRLRRQWELERNCFRMGDEVRAFNNMKKAISALKDPVDKNRALRELESMLAPPTEDDDTSSTTRDSRRSSNPPRPPRF